MKYKIIPPVTMGYESGNVYGWTIFGRTSGILKKVGSSASLSLKIRSA